MNIAEILKNCPKGIRLYSPIFGEVMFGYVSPDGWIKCYTTSTQLGMFYPDGTYSKNGEVMLFPSKEQRDWNQFQIPFQFGDIVAMHNEHYHHTNIAIFDKYIGDGFMKVVCTNSANSNTIKVFGEEEHWRKQGVRYATEKEKEFFFNLLKEQNYVWTGKELVNRFNIGDYITNGVTVIKITEITDNYYFGYNIKTNKEWSLPLHRIKDWELAKFDICSLKPYDRVLVKSDTGGCWYPTLVSYVESFEVYLIDTTDIASYVIPFEGNEHLIGKSDDPDPYYITWE